MTQCEVQQYFSVKFTNSVVDPLLEIVSNDLIEPFKKYELEIFNNIIDNYSPQTLREYLYLVYNYKLTPKKFLNVLQLILQHYTKQNLLDYNTSVFNYATLQSYFYQILGTINQPPVNGINIKILGFLLEQILNKDNIIEAIEQERICEFSMRVKMCYHFEDVFNLKNKEFENFIDDLYSTMFDYLKNSVQVDPYYTHFFNRKMLFWYLSSCLKKDLLENKIFMKEEVELSEIFYELLNNSNYKPSFDLEKMRTRTVQFIEGNILNIGNLFENLLETAVEKKLHSENIAYFLS